MASIPTGCEEYELWTVKSGLWLLDEERRMQEARFEEMPKQEENEHA